MTGTPGWLVAVAALTVGAILVRLYTVVTAPRTAKPSGRREAIERCSFAVFLGSGGHTSEALSLVSALDFNRYVPRTYIISEGDTLSMQKAVDLESAKAAEAPSTMPSSMRSDSRYTFVVIPRARRVHQTLLTTPFTAALSLIAAVWHITVGPLIAGPPVPEVLLLNGPGTCFVLCIATYLNRFLGLRSPKLIYIESFARVRHLSLSGKLLRPLVDRFIVQWPELVKDKRRDECHGWLV
ncbi:glycosyltransferase family 1 protein [Polyporus arcularius HHB13444]|uniref:UDP-N-acetylglucosamine transferase subunit ALG14 n=1 Tax=Polyporus arcularius HHB13444 TaxID=1314778 RepID=A0A5C3PLA7_9APHY|nr:glycosyltransferase family 1 protein [Polyporus arcularius HHB13444]